MISSGFYFIVGLVHISADFSKYLPFDKKHPGLAEKRFIPLKGSDPFSTLKRERGQTPFTLYHTKALPSPTKKEVRAIFSPHFPLFKLLSVRLFPLNPFMRFQGLQEFKKPGKCWLRFHSKLLLHVLCDHIYCLT
jgi:hypothetical protein